MLLSKLGRVEKSVEAHTGAVLAARWCGDYTALVSGVCICLLCGVYIYVFRVVCVCVSHSLCVYLMYLYILCGILVVCVFCVKYCSSGFLSKV